MNSQQMQLMAQMFQNPDGGPAMTPPQGTGGIGSGAAATMGPSFQGPDGAAGVQPLPFNGPMPDFQMPPYDPFQDPGFVPLGNNGPMGPGGWSPAAAGGQPVGRPMPARPGEGVARPMPLERISPPPSMGNGAYPRNMGGGVRGSDGMRKVPSKFGPNMDNMPRAGGQYGPNMDNMPVGPQGGDARGLPMDEEKRKALIQAILAKSFGG